MPPSDDAQDGAPAPGLLAVDLGLRTGLATYGRDGRLLTYGSTNFGSKSRLRAGAPTVIRGAEPLETVALEGDRGLANVWARAAQRVGVDAVVVTPETWRAAFLHPSEMRSGAEAKRAADRLARLVIAWAGARRPTSLRHDAAEAILIGLWAVLELGWLGAPPAELDPRRR